jgi:hypothetical protein
MLHKTKNNIIFAQSDKAETSSAGEQLVRNNLINENAYGGLVISFPLYLKSIFVSYALKNSY